MVLLPTGLVVQALPGPLPLLGQGLWGSLTRPAASDTSMHISGPGSSHSAPECPTAVHTLGLGPRETQHPLQATGNTSGKLKQKNLAEEGIKYLHRISEGTTGLHSKGQCSRSCHITAQRTPWATHGADTEGQVPGPERRRRGL